MYDIWDPNDEDDNRQEEEDDKKSSTEEFADMIQGGIYGDRDDDDEVE